MFEIDVVTPKPAQVRLKSSQNVSLVSCNIMGHDVLQILIDIAKSEKRPPTSPPPPISGSALSLLLPRSDGVSYHSARAAAIMTVTGVECT